MRLILSILMLFSFYGCSVSKPAPYTVSQFFDVMYNGSIIKIRYAGTEYNENLISEDQPHDSYPNEYNYIEKIEDTLPESKYIIKYADTLMSILIDTAYLY